VWISRVASYCAHQGIESSRGSRPPPMNIYPRIAYLHMPVQNPSNTIPFDLAHHLIRIRLFDHYTQHYHHDDDLAGNKGTLCCKVYATISGPISYQTLCEPSSHCGDRTSFTYCTPAVATRPYVHLYLTDACLRGSYPELSSYARNTTVVRNLLQASVFRRSLRAIQIRRTLLATSLTPSTSPSLAVTPE
jgi:hypothetical protein